TASVHMTEPDGPTTSAIVSEGSPGPPATSSTDWPARMPASSMSARVKGANITRMVGACFSQYGADSRHMRMLSLCILYELTVSTLHIGSTGSPACCHASNPP